MRKMRVIINIALLLCTFLIISKPIMAAQNQTNRKLVRVGAFPFAGYHEKNQNGEMSGYGIDILEEMLVFENWQYDYIGYDDNISWSDAQAMLDSGKIDMLTSATKNAERLKKYDYSDIPIGTSSTMLTVKAGDNRYDTSDYSAWNNIRVGMIKNNSRNSSFAKYAKKNDFTYKSFKYDTSEELEEALANGNLDMIVTSNLLELDGVSIVDHFDKKSFYVIVKKGNTQLLSEVNNALTQIQNQNRTLQKIYL